jgi:hypothetical protein
MLAGLSQFGSASIDTTCRDTSDIEQQRSDVTKRR